MKKILSTLLITLLLCTLAVSCNSSPSHSSTSSNTEKENEALADFITLATMKISNTAYDLYGKLSWTTGSETISLPDGSASVAIASDEKSGTMTLKDFPVVYEGKTYKINGSVLTTFTTDETETYDVNVTISPKAPKDVSTCKMTLIMNSDEGSLTFTKLILNGNNEMGVLREVVIYYEEP